MLRLQCGSPEQGLIPVAAGSHHENKTGLLCKNRNACGTQTSAGAVGRAPAEAIETLRNGETLFFQGMDFQVESSTEGGKSTRAFRRRSLRRTTLPGCREERGIHEF